MTNLHKAVTSRTESTGTLKKSAHQQCMYFFRELLNQNRPVHNSFDDKSLLKLTFTTRPIRCTVALGTSILSTATFFPGFLSLSLPPVARFRSVGTRTLGTRLLSMQVKVFSFSTFIKGKVRVHYNTQLIMKCPRYINKVDFL